MTPQFSASDAAVSGFRLVREHRKTIAVWVVIMTVVSIINTVLVIRFFGSGLSAVMDLQTSAGGGEAEAAELAKTLETLAPFYLYSLVYTLGLYAVMMAALNRLILRPGDDRASYLRLGMAELRQVGVFVLLYLIAMAASFVATIAVVIVAVVFGVLTGGNSGVITAVSMLGLIGVAVGVLYVLVRLSFLSSIAFDTGKISPRAAWAMSKGVSGRLIGTYAVAVALAVVVYLLVMVILVAVGLGVGGMDSLAALMKPDTSSLQAFFTPARMVQTLFTGAIQVLIALLLYSPIPTIYRQLRGGDVTDTFG
jgi:hypothetical protein